MKPATDSQAVRTGLESQWHVHWNSVIVGVLAAVSIVALFGFVGLAIGAHKLSRGASLAEAASLGGLLFSILGMFVAFAAGGWIAGKLADLRQAKAAMLHGAVVWLAAIPLLLVLGAIGAFVDAGSWYTHLAGGMMTGESPDPAALIATRNAALGAVAAMFTGFIGVLAGGWLASDERFTLVRDQQPDQIPAVGRPWPAD